MESLITKTPLENRILSIASPIIKDMGFELISKVPPTLHTPLMSGANAISGITIVGALILSNEIFSGIDTSFAAILAFLALVMATINVVGGFMVTNKMLEMIAGKKRKGGN